MGADFEFVGTERFQIRRKLGQGGMGVVYEAFDRERDAVVAIKTLPWANPARLYSFKREFRALADIEHPNLIGLGELIESEGQWFFTMDFVDGVDFLRYVRGPLRRDNGSSDESADGRAVTEATPLAPDVWGREATLPSSAALTAPKPTYDENRLRAATSQLGLAIAALHQAGKVHRDIKPPNILITDDGRLTLLDFGLVVDASDDMYDSTRAQVVGTAAYMAPEQAVSGAVGPAADWYSFGVVLYEALTGGLPYTGATAIDVLMKKQQYEPPPPRARSSQVPPDLDGLCVDLLMRNPEERPSAREVLDRLGVDATATTQLVTMHTTSQLTEAAIFVGRESEIEVLRAAFARTQRGAAEVVLVEGESGMGKSTLISRFTEDVCAEVTNAVVLSGRCHERESVPYKALDGVIDALSRYLRGLADIEVAALIPRNAAILTRIFPVLGRVEAIARAPRPKTAIADPHLLRQRAFGALRELMCLCAERRPLIVCIDDLQWTDADSLTALRELVLSDQAPSLLLVLSSRVIETDGPLAQLLTSLKPQRLRLAPLTADVGTELAVQLLERAGASSKSAAKIAHESAGHPLYIAELARHVMRSGASSPKRLRLEDAIFARVTELPTVIRSLLDLVAVSGTPLPREIVRAAAKLDVESFRRHISILRVAHLVATKRAHGRDTIEPFHDRVRQAVLADLGDEQRRACHERLALALRTSGDPHIRPERVLLHLEGAGMVSEASRYAEEAAFRAQEALSFDLASQLFATALRLGDYEAGRRREVLIAQANATANAGRRAEAARLYLDAVEGAPVADAIELQRLAAESLLVSGHLDEGIDVLRTVLGELGISAPSSPANALLTVMLRRAWLGVRGLRFREREETEVAPDRLRRVDACWTAGLGFAMSHSVSGMVFQVRHLHLALKAGEPVRVATALGFESTYIATAGKRARKRAFAVAARCRELAERTGDQLAMAWAHVGVGMAHYQNGEFTEALDCWGEAERRAYQLRGGHYERATLQLLQLWPRYYLGQWRELARRVPAALRAARDRGDLYSATNFATGMPSAAWLIRDNSARAERLAREHAERWSSRHGFHLQHYWEMYALAQGSLYDLDPERAWEIVNGKWAVLRRSLLLRVCMVGIEAHDLRARCALALAARLDANDVARRMLARQARRSLRKIRKARLPCSDALARLLNASLSVLSGDMDAGVEQTRHAIDAFETSHMAAHATIARWRLGELLRGDEGAALLAEAKDWMKRQEVVSPAHMVELVAPGFRQRSTDLSGRSIH